MRELMVMNNRSGVWRFGKPSLASSATADRDGAGHDPSFVPCLRSGRFRAFLRDFHQGNMSTIPIQGSVMNPSYDGLCRPEILYGCISIANIAARSVTRSAIGFAMR
jgi:hypothetical protein